MENEKMQLCSKRYTFVIATVLNLILPKEGENEEK